MKIYEFHDFSLLPKNKKPPETLDFAGFSGGVFGVPERIRTSDLPLRRWSLYPAELRKHMRWSNENIITLYAHFVKR